MVGVHQFKVSRELSGLGMLGSFDRGFAGALYRGVSLPGFGT